MHADPPSVVMDLLKVLLLAVSTSCFLVVLRPPKRAVAGQSAIYRGQLFEYLVRFLAYLGCVLVTLSSLSHALLLLSQHPYAMRLPPLAPYLCPASASTPPLHALTLYTPRFLLGITLTVAGTCVRLTAMRALGALFTYELVIKHEHRLVTSGPYAIVRHPGYTGVALLLLGTHLVHFGAAGYVTQCGIEGTPVVVFVWIWRTGSVFTVVSLYRRCAVEDAQLRERFGEGWKRYAARVPYCLVPYVY